jgi:NAD(P)-dependent dehydrogenase (short-subunit alcohol dehydrogenase family)
MPWTVDNVPDLTGRTVVITGGNSGIGLEAGRGAIGKGARVLLACRNAESAQEACDQLVGDNPSGSAEFVPLDLASLKSVRACAEALHGRCEAIDVLINNAGVMAIPRRETEDGFEMQLGTNHFGHFALTALVYPQLRDTAGARIVNVSSLAHNFGFLNFQNLHGRMFYDPWLTYGTTKLANLLFTYELDRRLKAAERDVAALACHPGISATNLGYAGPRMLGSAFGETLVELYTSVIAQSAAMGALPTLYAAFAEGAKSGDYIGPDGLGEMRGHPRKVSSSFLSHSQSIARQLWAVSEEETGIPFQV